MMDLSQLPPANDARLASSIFKCRPQDRDDAIQEAWVSHLAGERPSKAVDRFRKRMERDYAASETSDFDSRAESIRDHAE